MSYFVQQDTKGGQDFDHLVAFQEASAHEVSHRRQHAAIAEDPEVMRFREKAMRPRDVTPHSR